MGRVNTIQKGRKNSRKMTKKHFLCNMELCNDVEKGKCGIPNFQRYWTWNRKQIEELWESIFQGYYIGSLLIWETNNEKRT